jgi:hypothetical protein
MPRKQSSLCDACFDYDDLARFFAIADDSLLVSEIDVVSGRSVTRWVATN